MLQPPPLASPDRARILVVDDDGEILALVAKFLRSNGFEVGTARSGAEMQAQLLSAPADLVVLDVMLPGTNGLDLCRGLRAESDVPVIMLTAKGDEIDRIVGLEVGADDYLRSRSIRGSWWRASRPYFAGALRWEAAGRSGHHGFSFEGGCWTR